MQKKWSIICLRTVQPYIPHLPLWSLCLKCSYKEMYHRSICTICHYRNMEIEMLMVINSLSTVQKLHVQQPGERTVLQHRFWIRLHMLRRHFKGEVLLSSQLLPTSWFGAVLPVIAHGTAVWHVCFLYWYAVDLLSQASLIFEITLKQRESLSNVTNFADFPGIKRWITVPQRMACCWC